MATGERPSSDAARNARMAISLRLATRMRRIGAGTVTSAVMMEVLFAPASLPGRGRACPGHPGYSRSAPSCPGSPGQARRRRRLVIQRGRNPLSPQAFRLFLDQRAEPALFLFCCRGLGRSRLRGRGNCLAEFLEKLAGELFRGGIDQARAELGKLAADLRLHLVVQGGGAGGFSQMDDSAALGEAGWPARPLAGDRKSVV